MAKRPRKAAEASKRGEAASSCRYYAVGHRIGQGGFPLATADKHVSPRSALFGDCCDQLPRLVRLGSMCPIEPMDTFDP